VDGVPSYALQAGCEVRLASRHLRVDLAYAGGFYAIVDSEAGAVPLTNTRVADLRRLGKDICAALAGHDALAHPAAADRRHVAAVVFTSQPRSGDAHLRCVSVRPHGGCDRSPGVGATAAVMAVLNAMGLLREGDDFMAEGLLDVVQRGAITHSIEVGEVPGVITEIEGTAWITGEQTMIVDDADPLRDGFDVD
jgi:proline racemase